MFFLVQPNLSRILQNDFETISAIFLYKYEFCIFPPCQIDIVEFFSNCSKNTGQVRLDKKNIGCVEKCLYFVLMEFISKNNGMKTKYDRLNVGVFRASLQSSLYLYRITATHVAAEYRWKLLQSSKYIQKRKCHTETLYWHLVSFNSYN